MNVLEKGSFRKPLILIGLLAGFGIFNSFIGLPVYAHHPFDGPAESFSISQGFLSGLAHPVFGIDHLLFLFSIGLVGRIASIRWVPLLLFAGLLGAAFSQFMPLLPVPESVIGISLIAAAFVALGHLHPGWMAPLIAAHGLILGQAIIGAEPSPLLAYFTGLLISEVLLIVFGLKFFRSYLEHKRIFSGILIGMGITITYGNMMMMS